PTKQDFAYSTGKWRLPFTKTGSRYSGKDSLNTTMPSNQPEMASSSTRETAALPPAARRFPRVHVYHDDRSVDDYFWLREKADPQVTAYLQAENAYTDAVMAPTQALQETLYREMLSHIKQTDMEVPYR